MTQWNLAIASYKRKVTNGFVILKSLKQDMVSWSSKHLKLKEGHNAMFALVLTNATENLRIVFPTH